MDRRLGATLAWLLGMGVCVGACGDNGADGGTTQSSGSAATSSGGSGTGTGSSQGGASGTTGGFSTGSMGTGSVMGCNPETFTLKQSPPAEVYLVIDRSGSMTQPGADPMKTRWEELKDAIDVATSQYESSVDFGLLMYPTGSECGTSGPQVKFGTLNHTAIKMQLDATTPAGGTPTAAALNNAADSLKQLGTPGSSKFLVVATDGGPNCDYFLNAQPACSCTYAQPQFCCTNYPSSCTFGSSCLDDVGTIDTVQGLLANEGIGTFVIRLSGTDDYVDVLDQMAMAGGHPQMGGMHSFYDGTDEPSLLAALQAIAVSVISCQIDLTKAPDDPTKVSVYVDGQKLSHDDTQTNGWDYTDASNTTIELYGQACQTIQDGMQHDVTATFECMVM